MTGIPTLSTRGKRAGVTPPTPKLASTPGVPPPLESLPPVTRDQISVTASQRAATFPQLEILPEGISGTGYRLRRAEDKQLLSWNSLLASGWWYAEEGGVVRRYTINHVISGPRWRERQEKRAEVGRGEEKKAERLGS